MISPPPCPIQDIHCRLFRAPKRALGRMKADARFSIRKQNADIAVGEVKLLFIGFSAAYLGISECCNMGSQSTASQ